jgi:hypothetical protein
MVHKFLDLEADASWLMQLRVEGLGKALSIQGGNIIGIREFWNGGLPKLRVYYELPGEEGETDLALPTTLFGAPVRRAS